MRLCEAQPWSLSDPMWLLRSATGTMAGRANGRLLEPGRRSDEPVPLHEIEIEVMPRFGCVAAETHHTSSQELLTEQG